MVTHHSILLIDDSPGERELFRLALAQTGLDTALFAEQDAEAALHFLSNQHYQWSFQARSLSSSEGSLNRSPSARIEGAHSDRAASASQGDHSSLPSLILLDWRLGKQRGDEFLKRLRTNTRFAAIPVVVFTTSDDAADLSLAYASGANGYVVKPSTFAELVQCTADICQYWLNRNRAPQMIGTPC